MGIIKQLTSFGVVGIVSTITHAVVFQVGHSGFELNVLIANLLGFGVAFVVSYLGQFNFTFKQESLQLGSKHKVKAKFFVASILGLSLNITWGYIIIDIFNLRSCIFLFFLCVITPLVLFALNKWWVFRHSDTTSCPGILC